jgi:hypothetical protein
MDRTSARVYVDRPPFLVNDRGAAVRKRCIPKPTPSMLVAILALILATSSSAIAASALMNGDKLIMRHSLSGNRLRNHTLTGAQINLRRLGQVPSSGYADRASSADSAAYATTADSAAFATTAGSATAAGTAANALSLGGIAASGYTRDDCRSLTGQIKGWGVIPASPTFPTSFVDLASAFNCSGQPVQARRLTAGGYEVRFLRSPVRIAVGNIVLPSLTPASAGMVNFALVGPGDFDVAVTDGSGTTGLDEPFDVVTP